MYAVDPGERSPCKADAAATASRLAAPAATVAKLEIGSLYMVGAVGHPARAAEWPLALALLETPARLRRGRRLAMMP